MAPRSTAEQHRRAMAKSEDNSAWVEGVLGRSASPDQTGDLDDVDLTIT